MKNGKHTAHHSLLSFFACAVVLSRHARALPAQAAAPRVRDTPHAACRTGKYRAYLLEQAAGYDTVFVLAGNHEFYGGIYEEVKARLAALCSEAREGLPSCRSRLRARSAAHCVGF